jgi:hypothetical protein
MNGNTLVGGAQFDDTMANQAGAAFVYVRSGATWTQQAMLLAPDGASSDNFGWSVAISGDTIVVGAYRDDSPLANAGSAYVFVRNGLAWAFQQKLTAPGADAAVQDEFGNAVAVQGDKIFVGAHSANLPGNNDSGAVYVFRPVAGVWTQTDKLTPTPGTGGSTFGYSFGDSIVIGSALFIGAPSDQFGGAVYHFGEFLNHYQLQTKLFNPANTPGDLFGSSVAIDGTTLIVGARDNTPIQAQPAYGAAYVYEFNGATWSSQGKLTAADGASFDRFGWSVGISNNVVAVGARDDVTGVGINAGSAYIFTRSGATWTQARQLAPADAATGDRFGASVALNSGQLVIGAAEKNLTSPTGQGAAYYYTVAAATVCDFDGDGKTDVSVYRPAAGAWYLERSQAGLLGVGFGLSTDKIAPADYDGDGKTDIAVYRPANGTWYILNSATNTVSYSVFGTAEDLPTPADFDGDGRADVSLFRPSNGSWYRLNSVNGLLFQAQFGANGDKPAVGDYDGDGRADIGFYRQPNRPLYVLLSSYGSFLGNQVPPFFSSPTDRPIPGDFDADGKTDFALFRPQDSLWLNYRHGHLFTDAQFGASGDIPSVGDFDGDGKADVSVFRPSDGNWYRLNSTDGSFYAEHFGATGDLPAPGAFGY